MELKHIKELMAAMGRTRTKKLSLKRDDFELVLEREEGNGGIDYSLVQLDEQFKQPYILNRADQAFSRGSEMPAGRVSSPVPTPKEDPNCTFVTSPMVGTFYLFPSPEDPPFVKVGDKIEKDTVVCIIEAMKVMNEIKAGVSGTVSEILIETGQPVEFGTKLFCIIE